MTIGACFKTREQPPPPKKKIFAPELVCAVKVSCIYVFGMAFKLGVKLKVIVMPRFAFGTLWYLGLAAVIFSIFFYIFSLLKNVATCRDLKIHCCLWYSMCLSMKWMLRIYMYTSLQLCHLQHSESKLCEE